MTKYFLYSSTQLAFMREMEAKRGRVFKVGSVIHNGVKKPFTEISSRETSRYTDSKVVASGEVEFMSYTMPRSE